MNVLLIILGVVSTTLLGIATFFVRQTYLKFNALADLVNDIIIRESASQAVMESIKERLFTCEKRLNHHSDRFSEYDRNITEFYKTYELKRKD